MLDKEKVAAVFAAGQLMRIAGEELLGFRGIPEPQQFFVIEPNGDIAGLYNLRKLEMLLHGL
jgi:hypothetical protein